MPVKNNCDQTLKSYESIFNTSLDAILLTHPDGTIFYANSTAEKLFEYSADEIYELGRSGLVDTEDPNLDAMLKERKLKGRSRGELTFIKKTGEKIPCDISTTNFKTENGQLNTFMVIRDISKQEKTERSLKESENTYHSLFDNNHAVMLLIDYGTGEIVNANSAACTFYGYTHEKLIQMNISDINILTESEIHKKLTKAKLGLKNNFIFKHRLESGEIRDVEVFSGCIKIEGRDLLYSIVHDISLRKLIESNIKESLTESQRIQNELITLIENIVDEVWFCDFEGKIVLANAAARKFEHRMKYRSVSHLDDILSETDIYDLNGNPRPRKNRHC